MNQNNCLWLIDHLARNIIVVLIAMLLRILASSSENFAG